MINQVGFYSLIFGFLISIYILIYSYNLIRFSKRNDKVLLSFLSLQFFFVLFSFGCLIVLFVKSDFSNLTVYNHSHTLKPIFYKIAGSWGNHEGSLLLWLIVLTCSIILFFYLVKIDNINYRYFTIIIQQFLICGFFLFVIFTSNPFEYLYPVPIEGLGLNPILQDPALAIHPPILYVGYVGTSVIFSSSLSALITNNVNKDWAKEIKLWVYISWIFLTLGILLGSIWAYYELGWGGFWFWDPVENVSLMPWFTLTALLHCVTVLEKRNSLKSWSIILSITTFILSMSGTFLVRSGILNSIHTFANDPERGLFILIFLFFVSLLAIVLFFIYPLKDNDASKYFLLSKETMILVNNWFLMYFLSVVLIGTLYPIFLEVVNGSKISIGPPFYHKLLIPFLIFFLIFMAFGPKINWIKDKISKINISQIFLLILSLLISYLILKNLETKYLFATILFSFAFLLFFITLKDLFSVRLRLPQKISHFSFSIFILSILFNGVFSKEISANMKVGDTLNFEDKTIYFKSINQKKESNFTSLIGTFILENENRKSNIFLPEIRLYKQPKTITAEADIKVNLFYDNFLTFNLIKDDEIFNMRYQYKPLMLWIWLSTFFLAVSGIISLVKR